MEILDSPIYKSHGKSVEDVLADGYDFKLGDYVSKGIEIFQKNLGLFVVFTLIYFIGRMVIGAFPGGTVLVSIFFDPMIIAGYYIVAKKESFGKPAAFDTFFDGFKYFFAPLALQGFISTIVTFFLLIPFSLLILSLFISLDDVDSSYLNFPFSSTIVEFANSFAVLSLLILLPGIYLWVSWCLALNFIVHYKMTAWEAMESSRKIVGKKWAHFLAFGLIVGAPCIILGLLICGIGLLATVPIIYLCFYSAFEHIMELKETEADTP